MKKLLIITTIFFLVQQGFAQADSMNMKTGPFLIESRDTEFISSFISTNDQLLEFFYGDIREKLTSSGAPAGTSVIRIDSVKVSTLIFLSLALRSSAYSGTKHVYNRIDAAIRACNNSFLLNYLKRLDKKDDDNYNAILQSGRKKLAKKS